MARIPPNSVGLAGEFAVLSQLTLRGYNAGMTLGHTKGIDILVHHPSSGEMYQVEVKTNLEQRNGPTDSRLFGKFVTGWQMNEKHENVSEPNLFYCFVHINGSRIDPSKYDFRFFIVPSAVVAKYLRKEHASWLAADASHKANPRRVFRIGLANEPKVKVQAPLASDWENNWDFCRQASGPLDAGKNALTSA